MDHAFTDQMVRADKEDLTQAVMEYLQTYKGNFQPILDARKALSEGYDLNVAEIRTILNVMRADTSIRLEYTPPAGQVIQFPERRRGVVFDEDERPALVRPKFQELVVWGRIKDKWVYGISLHKTSLNVHLIDHERTTFKYKQAGARGYSRRTGWLQVWENRIEIDYRWECGTRNPTVKFLTEHEAACIMNSGLMKLCPTCHAIRTRVA